MLKWWQDLDSREHQIIILAGIVLLLVLYFSAVWYPLNSATDRAERRLANSQSDLLWMRTAAPQIELIKEANTQPSVYDGTVLSLIGETAARSNMVNAIKKLDPEGATLARVTLEKGVYTDFMRWILIMRNEYGARIVNAGIRRGGLTGTMDGEFTVEAIAK